MFLDECGFALNLHRLYGWVIGGGRCQESVPFNKGKNRSVVGAFGLSSPHNPTGMLALWQKDGAWNQSLFTCFVEEAVLPRLQPGSVLVLDNARIHHGEPLRQAVEKAGCQLLFLPPYSPDFSPIELAWGWIKAYVRSLAPRDNEVRIQAIYAAWEALPHQHAAQWFKHCGLS